MSTRTYVLSPALRRALPATQCALVLGVAPSEADQRRAAYAYSRATGQLSCCDVARAHGSPTCPVCRVPGALVVGVGK